MEGVNNFGQNFSFRIKPDSDDFSDKKNVNNVGLCE